MAANAPPPPPPPAPMAKRARKELLKAPGAFHMDLRAGCLCCGSSWCAEPGSTIAAPSESSRCRAEVLALRDRLVCDRRHFHQHPEVAFQEHATAAFCATRLKELGFQVTEAVAPGTGIVAVLKGEASAGPCLALRADMDALPIQEEPAEGEAPLPFASQNCGVMHACGHDAHMAIMLCVAEVISSDKFKARIRGTIKIIFQPAEESGNAEHPNGGAWDMVHTAKVLDDVDAIYGCHVWTFAPVGVVGVSAGCVMAACDSVIIDIEGRGGHGAAPQGTVDAVLVMGHLITALHSIVSRNQDPSKAAVLTIGSAEAGEAPNVIAARAKLKATVRCLDSATQGIMKRRVHEVCQGIASTFGAKVFVDYVHESPNVINDSEAAEAVKNAAINVVHGSCVQKITTMASEDFAFFLKGSRDFAGVTVPGVRGCFFFVGASCKAEEAGSRAHHNPAFTIDEDSMLIGASVFVELIEQQMCTVSAGSS